MENHHLAAMPKTLTAVYKKSVTGKNFIGFLKEYPDAISQGSTPEELSHNLLDAMFALMDAKSKYGSEIANKFDNDETFEMQVPLAV